MTGNQIEQAFDFRGDVTITRRDGSTIEGYLFDRGNSGVKLYPKDSPDKLTIPYADIQDIALTGRDPAAGKSWAAWVKRYFERKAAGEKNIAIEPEHLD